MKATAFILCCAFALVASAETNPEAGGIVIQPNDGEIAPGDEITITFPSAMVNTDKIDMADQPCPFVSAPKIEGTFLWKSETEGVFTVKNLVAGKTHRLMLAPGLTNASGQRVDARWSIELAAKAFDVTTDFEEREHLNAQPQIALNTTYDVRLTEVAEHIYLQDRQSRQRFPVDVIIWNEEKTPPAIEAKEFRVSPRAALPADRTFDLIVNGLVESKTRQALPYLKVFPAGKTAPLKVEWVAAMHDALDAPRIDIKFSDDVDPAEATPEKIRVEPAVKNMKVLASGDDVVVRGDFDTTHQYRVTISPQLKGERGFSLPNESRWKATFREPQPALLFPASQIFVRAKPEVRFSFFQYNTPAVAWKLARVPLEKLPTVSARVREFEKEALNPLTGKAIVDPRTGFTQQFQTELLVDGFKLPVVASGTIDAASGEKATQRDLRITIPKGEPIAGAYIIEASAKLADGRVVGNRSIICASDLVLTQKRTASSVVVRLTKMSDGQPVAGATVRAVTKENVDLASALTDKNGMSIFPKDRILPEKRPGVHLFIADSPNGPAMQFAEGATYAQSGETSRAALKPHAEIITDRNLYRPGQMVKMKGLVRELSKIGLTIPAAMEVRWRVTESYGERAAGEGTTTLSSDGGWEAEWTVPEKLKLGRYEIRCKIDNQDYDGSTPISIEEYRVPLFDVAVETENAVGQKADARVASKYFHGAPNVGARVHWKATWSVASGSSSEEAEGETDSTSTYRRRFNTRADLGPAIDLMTADTKTVEGDAKLDEHGFASVACESPFKDNAAVEKAHVFWRADVTSADGQTITGGEAADIFPNETRLGIKTEEKLGDNGGVSVDINAVNSDNKKTNGVAVHVDLFHVVTKVAKEQIAPFVFRYRNVDELTKVASQDVKTPAKFVFPAKETGRYAIAASATDRKAVLVSDETTVTGEQPAELPVQNETSFAVTHETKMYAPGEKATLSIQAPFGGVAWVSVETDEILDTLLVPLSGNAARIELPIKKEYAPNATVAIYIVRPGGKDELPRERFAATVIEVRRPERELKIEPHLAASTVKPGENVRGDIKVTSENKPVQDVDLAVFAVDDAVLKLGSWQLPNVLADFYPRNPFGVRSYQSLHNFVEQILAKSLTQKGFIIGGGGEDEIANVKNVRKEFKTLAFWQGSLKTNRDGKANFEFVAPDNLTTFRVVAVGQTKAHQFGGDANTTLQVSKPLLINAALPRFLRDGDEVELRASVQQNFADADDITVKCVTDAHCKLAGDASAMQNARRDAPTVFRFKAHVEDVDLAPVKIRFEAIAKSNAKMSDAMELTLPVQPPTIVRKETIAGTFNGPQFEAQSKMPNDWKRGHGKFDATISTTAWLPKIAGIPMILDYPHGCFEQISTKLLGYSLLANLLAYLPEVQARDSDYRAILERGMTQYNESLLADGFLPYWPGGDTPNEFVTCEAFWAVNESVKAGFEAPEGLRDKLAGALKKMVKGERSTSSFDKCFALFVLTQYETEEDLSAAAQDLYLRRNQSTDEARALLAIALHRLNIMPREKEQLLNEIAAPVKERAFDPQTFTSMNRAEAIIALAFDTVAPKLWTKERKERVRARMLQLMDSSVALSTQENLWLLLAFKSMVAAENAPRLTNAEPKGALSQNGCSSAWLDRKIDNQLSVTGLNKAALTFLMKAEYSTHEVQTDRVDRGFRVERVVRNMTDAKRTGEQATPFRIGDQVLITYRINTRKKQNYVALEDALPAGLEVVNPNLASVSKFFELPNDEAQDRHVLALSHSEMRDKATLLYFDDFDPGTGTYSVLARATAAGTFRWPATQVVPMYDSRFSGLSPSTLCVISGD
ncbi:MAG: alpha-2-macroglobulin [Verrucomicrobiota bacterium]